jgi:hypothetical protein
MRVTEFMFQEMLKNRPPLCDNWRASVGSIPANPLFSSATT